MIKNINQMEEERTSKQYDNWSGIYDLTFGKLVSKRVKRSIKELQLEPGQTVLDIGIGTGVSLGHYPEGTNVVGMDISEGMLKQARNQANKHNHLGEVTLVQADAMNAPFKPHSFDAILITHVISVVSDSDRLLEKAAQLVKPGGRIVVLNHFQSNIKPIAWAEKVLNPLFVRLGWRSDLCLAKLVNNSNLQMKYYFKLQSCDIWQIVVFANEPSQDNTLAVIPDESDKELITALAS